MRVWFNCVCRGWVGLLNQASHLVEFPGHLLRLKLFQEVSVLQGVQCHNLSTSPLPFISGREEGGGGGYFVDWSPIQLDWIKEHNHWNIYLNKFGYGWHIATWESRPCGFLSNGSFRRSQNIYYTALYLQSKTRKNIHVQTRQSNGVLNAFSNYIMFLYPSFSLHTSPLSLPCE